MSNHSRYKVGKKQVAEVHMSKVKIWKDIGIHMSNLKVTSSPGEWNWWTFVYTFVLSEFLNQTCTL